MKEYKIAIINEDEKFGLTLKKLLGNCIFDTYTNEEDGLNGLKKKNFEILILRAEKEIIERVREIKKDIYIISFADLSDESALLSLMDEIDIQDCCSIDLEHLNSTLLKIKSATKSVELMNRTKSLLKSDNFPTRLKLLREAKGENQNQLADLLGVSRQTISGYESGRNEPKFDVLKTLSKHYGVSIDFLLNNKFLA